ncbi:MAG: hypothetical protein IPJ43_08975 [Saprospiraceae bacterium]|nr:hypothetical protein [Saprospiraceae bacterium]MBK7466935.1 hypothetical protein [Saprospiraceae bacterium]
MTKKNLNYFFILYLFIICNSCKKEELVLPSYLSVQELKLVTTVAQGSSKHNFKDVWVFVGGNYIGAYEVPFTVPVSTLGTQEVEMFAGIRVNGVLTIAARYALCDSYKNTHNFISQDTIVVKPVFTYSSEVKFPFHENFESLHFFNEERDGDLDTKMVNSGASESFEGANSGLIELSASNPNIETWYDFDRVIPVSTNAVYLEFHYKSDIPFSIGFVAFKQGLFDKKYLNATVLPKGEWTRVYFDFGPILNVSEASSYKIAIAASFKEDLGKAKQRILIDNLKVGHR